MILKLIDKDKLRKRKIYFAVFYLLFSILFFLMLLDFDVTGIPGFLIGFFYTFFYGYVILLTRIFFFPVIGTVELTENSIIINNKNPVVINLNSLDQLTLIYKKLNYAFLICSEVLFEYNSKTYVFILQHKKNEKAYSTILKQWYKKKIRIVEKGYYGEKILLGKYNLNYTEIQEIKKELVI